ncbi:dynamin family protein [Formosa sp. PL04]|uniref:dynamin family protein n=1 Tax=Formosa sp. PL04 TaxID=3081755 RepID=UPI002981CA4B|nr:dynamin family protein [Formosa sp. PL04]MDW5288581.1 dynamin family protein [Formosa sp. PL04]
MNQYRKSYLDKKNNVLELLGKTATFLQKYESEDQAESCINLHEQVEKGNFSIVVVGEFSAGKSTFLNAMMGNKYLPSTSSETTATVNFLKHKNQALSGEGVRVYYKDNTEKTYPEASFETIENFVSTKGDNVAEKISRVDLFLDSKFLEDGVTLVDSPGLNGVAGGHKEVTESQIEKSHAAIFMFSAVQPGSKSDFEFLSHLKSKCKNIIIVLNRIDSVNESEQTVADVINKLKTSFQSQFPNKKLPEIWPISAFAALVSRNNESLEYLNKLERSNEERNDLLKKSRIEDFENRLLRFLTQGEKAKAELLSPVYHVKSMLLVKKQKAEQLISELERATDTEEVENHIITLEKEISEIGKNLANEEDKIYKQVELLVRDFERGVKSDSTETKDKYIAKLENQEDLEELEINYERYITKLNSDLLFQYEHRYTDFINDFKDIIRDNFSEMAGEIEKKLPLSKVQLDGNKTLSLDSKVFETKFGLEEHTEELKQKEAEIERLDDEMESTEINKGKAIFSERQIADLDFKREKIGSNNNQELRPDVDRRTVTKEKYRRGLIGGLWGILVSGQKTYTEEVVDDSAQKYYDQEKKRKADEEKRIKEEIESKIAKLEKNESSVELEILLKQLERRKEKKEEEIQKKREEFKLNMLKEGKTILRNAIIKVEDLIDETQKDATISINKFIKSKKEEFTKEVIIVVSNNLNELISLKKKELELKKKQLSSSVEEKTIIISNTQTEISSIKKLLGIAIEISSELESEETDVIKMAN